MEPIIIATWPFARQVVQVGGELLQNGAAAMDAAVEGVCTVEDDPKIETVGFGGLPNLNGEVQLDAACMDGKTLAIGAVMGLEGYKNPCRVAQGLVGEYRNNVLCGQGAADYARENGYQPAVMITDERRKQWEEAMARGQRVPVGHDTVCCLALDKSGDLAAVVSTSGLGYKHRGRVGDSPLVGSGFYADNDVGAAAATGVGEDIMKGCVSFAAVQYMRAGMPVQQAVDTAMADHIARLGKAGVTCGNFAMIALDKAGNYAGGSTSDDFTYSVFSQKQLQTFDPGITAPCTI